MASLAFMLVATWPLINHLGQPQRALNIMITPNPSSAMAGFGLAYNWSLMILLLEVWFVFRKDIVLMARQSRGLKRTVFAALSLGTYDISEEALSKDHKIVTVLAAIGTVLTAAYLLQMVRRVNQGAAADAPAIADVCGLEAVAWLPLVALSIAFGVLPFLVLDVTTPAVAALLGGAV